MWQAEYEQHGSWHKMLFNFMTVDARPGGKIEGRGEDEVGKFDFKGSFNNNTSDCRIHKQYLGKHEIFYQGQLNQQTGQVIGSWGFKAGGNDGGFRMRRV